MPILKPSKETLAADLEVLVRKRLGNAEIAFRNLTELTGWELSILIQALSAEVTKP